ncbi:hypothetical protein PMIN02_003715 [Paraphaeosphaeria minitans]
MMATTAARAGTGIVLSQEPWNESEAVHFHQDRLPTGTSSAPTFLTATATQAQYGAERRLFRAFVQRLCASLRTRLYHRHLHSNHGALLPVRASISTSLYRPPTPLLLPATLLGLYSAAQLYLLDPPLSHDRLEPISYCSAVEQVH